MKPNVDDIFEIKIDRITYNGGRGIGRHFNFVVFVEGAAPGETLTVKVTKVKKSYCEAKLIKIIEPGPNRVTPTCQYYENCGGCQLQHISYEEQIIQKQSIVARVAKNLKVNIQPDIIESPKKINYRNRIQLHNKNSKLGFYKKNSHSFLEIHSCLIANEKINLHIKNILPSSERVEIALTTEGKVITRNPKKNNIHNLFSQVNTEVNQLLTQYILSFIEGKNYSHIYDAYCGQGNFTFPIHALAQTTPITGIEFSHNNIRAAKSKLSDINFVESSVENYFKQQPAIENSLVLLDPPRSGCHKTIFKNINKAKKIIYISCDLSTFERDAKILIQQGFQIIQFKGFDMFPQTSHIEVCAHFLKIEQ